MLRTVAARVLFGLIALLFVFRAENSSAQATDPNIKKKCVPSVPSAGDVLVTGGEDINEIQSGNSNPAVSRIPHRRMGVDSTTPPSCGGQISVRRVTFFTR